MLAKLGLGDGARREALAGICYTSLTRCAAPDAAASNRPTVCPGAEFVGKLYRRAMVLRRHVSGAQRAAGACIAGHRQRVRCSRLPRDVSFSNADRWVAAEF